MKSKQCKVCGCKPENGTEFYESISTYCKVHWRERVSENRAKNIEYYRAYDRARSVIPERKESAKRVYAKWLEKNPMRRRAQVALGNAVRSGQVKPWPSCAMPCCDKSPEAHHPDYSRPLDVVWLCPPHHKQAHAMARSA